MIFQEPMSSLNPCFTIGFQLMEALKTHLDMDKAARRRRTIELLSLLSESRHPKAGFIFPASTFWRHEPARHDCHGAGLPAQTADCR